MLVRLLQQFDGETYVDGGDGVALVLGVLEELEDIIASDDTGLAGENLVSIVVSKLREGGMVLAWADLQTGQKPLCM